MLGQLLEFAIHTQPSAAALGFYEQLGFHSLSISDVRGGPYAAVSDGALTLGLTAEEIEGPVPIFVRPDLKPHLRGLRRLGVRFDFTELADDEFNRAGFRDPNGRPVMLVEARTSSPAPRARTEVFACGEFLEWTVATHSLAESESFWAGLGLTRIAAGASPHAWLRMAGRGLVVGFHESLRLAAGLSFRAPDLHARMEYLQAKNVRVIPGAPVAPPGTNAATLIAPERTPFYLVEEQTPT
ncbi:MAG TPA: hypothetical protein VIM81_04045 [Gammaproteobacteria bacterium]